MEEEEPREQLGIEVGRLLRQGLAGLREAEDVLDPRRPDDERALGVVPVDGGDGLVDRRRVPHRSGRERLDELDVERALLALDERTPPPLR